MKKSIFSKHSVLALAAGLTFLAATTGRSLATLDNGWTLTGSASGSGGYVIVGSGTGLGALGPSTAPAFTSSGGGDTITLQAGGVATASGVPVIDIETTNNVVNNYGTITNPGLNGDSYCVLLDNGGNTLNNWGTINDPSDYGILSYGNGNIINNWGAINGYYSVYIDANANVFNNYGTINSTSEYGFEIYGNGNIINNRGLITTSQYYTFYIQASNTVINNWGTISAPSDVLEIADSLNTTINNWGLITGYQSGLVAFLETSNITLNNHGTLLGVNGYGIYEESGANGSVINNWGAITATGGDAAIYLGGNNNTVTLGGHSTVNGAIVGAGTGNVLVLNYTGMSPAAQAALKAQIAAQGSLSDWAGSFTVRGNTVVVDPMSIQFNLSSYQSQGLTPNQQAVGASLDSATVNPAVGSPLFNLYNTIDTGGDVPAALEALSPQKYEIYGDLAIANATLMTGEIDQRLNNLRDGSESIDTTGMGGQTSDIGSNAGQATAGYSKDDSKESKDVVQPAAPEKRWGFFAAGDGLFFRGNTRDIDGQQGKSDNAGTIAGVDGKVGGNAVIGALFAYNNADATLGSDNSHATIESYSGGIYAGYHQDGFYANGLAAYTRNDYSSDRNILFPGFAATAAGSTRGNQESVNLDGGYDFHATDRLTVGPLAGLQYVHLDVNGFDESGAGVADLALGSQDIDSLQSRIGGRIDYHLQVEPGVAFATELSAAWQHEYLDDSRGINAGFLTTGLAPFSVQTTSPLRDAGVVSLGVNFTFHDRLTLFADYSLLMWNASTFEQTVNGGMRISF